RSHGGDGIEAAAGYPATPCWVTTAEKCVSGRASAQILATVGMAITGKVMPAKAKAGPVIKLAKLGASRRFAVSAISSMPTPIYARHSKAYPPINTAGVPRNGTPSEPYVM